MFRRIGLRPQGARVALCPTISGATSSPQLLPNTFRRQLIGFAAKIWRKIILKATADILEKIKMNQFWQTLLQPQPI